MRVGINGFGRIGRLALRAALSDNELAHGLEWVAINEPSGSNETLALLAEFDSQQGALGQSCTHDAEGLSVGGQRMVRTSESEPGAIDWRRLGVDLVLECSGRFRKRALLEPHLERGAQVVLVSAPIADAETNVVRGVNEDAVDLASEPLLSAASCTTNCLAPVVRVLHDAFGIERGSVTTIHDPTNTQEVHDLPQKDPRRSRSALVNLIPTSTNSATAVTRILPELAGKLDSLAVRAPVLNASLVDAVFQVQRDVTVEEVNGALQSAAASGPLRGILGFESRPLVSCDFAGNPLSGIVDGPSTRVIDKRLVKVLAWYDNEWGYANRLAELAVRVAAARAGS